jgi:hypothetical protein
MAWLRQKIVDELFPHLGYQRFTFFVVLNIDCWESTVRFVVYGSREGVQRFLTDCFRLDYITGIREGSK